MASRSDPLGFDMAIGPSSDGTIDMSRDGRSASGVEIVRNAMIARSMADTISMIGAPGGVIDFGVDVRNWIGSPMTPGIAAQRAQQLAVVYARDPRLDAGSIRVSITTTRAGAMADFFISITARTTTALPISLVLAVSAVTVELLAQGT